LILYRNGAQVSNLGGYTNNVTFVSATSLALADAPYTFLMEASDTAGNTVNSSFFTITVDTTAPTVTIDSPTATEYTTDTIAFNYVASDATSSIDSCWYNLDGGTNHFLSDCSNTTLLLPDDTYTLNLFANDTVGNTGQESVTFTVTTTPPAVSLNLPADNSWLRYSGNLLFNYSPSTTSDIISCALWSDFSGSWQQTQTNQSVIQTDSLNNFLVASLSDGQYTWGVKCTDSQSRVGSSSNRTLSIDTAAPTVSIFAPTGTYDSTEDIPITYAEAIAFCHTGVGDVSVCVGIAVTSEKPTP